MRVKDLRFQILICIVLILSYAGLALSYYTSVRVKAESEMQLVAAEIVELQANSIDQTIFSKYDAFCNGDDVSGIETLTIDRFSKLDDDTYKVVKYYFSEEEAIKVDDKTYYIALAYNNKFDGFNDSDSKNTNLYYYFYNPNSIDIDKMFCRISPSEIYSGIITFNSYFTSTLGSIYYTNTGSTSENISGLVGSTSNYNFDEISNESNTFTQMQTVDGVNGILTGCKVTGGYLVFFIPIDSPYLAVEWVETQTMFFYIAGIIILIIMFADIIWGCKKASQLLRVERHTLESTKSIVIRIDKEGKVIFTNKTFKQLYGLKKLLDVSTFIDVESNLPIIESVKERRAFECSVNVGEEIKYLHLSPLYVSASYYLLGSDITVDYLRRKHLELMSGKNEITGCDNNFTLISEYNHIILNSAFYDIAFIEYNIYKYEEIVGIFGRSNFNELLKEYLDILKKTYNEYAIYHISDSKFIVVFPHVNIEDVNKKVESSLEIFKRPITIRNNNIYVRCKVVTFILKKDEARDVTLDHIKEKLDLGLRNIIDFQSRDYIIYAPQMDAVIERSLEMEEDLKRGLASNEFVMFLQPQYDVVANKIIGFEALIRWSNPKYSKESPQAFIELAEQRGYMLEIGRIVMEKSFDLAKKIENYGLTISINVSPIQILQVGFVSQFIEAFNSRRLKPGSIAIEITETFLMNNFQLVIEKLKILVKAGFHVHLDDFCTGYSSMLYLKELPVDTLKIDKGFTEEMLIDKTSAAIVKTIANLGLSLDMDLICEGIETQDQVDLIKKMGLRIIQGYYISKAIPVDEAIELLEKYNTPNRKKD